MIKLEAKTIRYLVQKKQAAVEEILPGIQVLGSALNNYYPADFKKGIDKSYHQSDGNRGSDSFQVCLDKGYHR